MNVDRQNGFRNEAISQQLLGANATSMNQRVPASMPGEVSLDLNGASSMSDLAKIGKISADKLILKATPSDGVFVKPVAFVGPHKAAAPSKVSKPVAAAAAANTKTVEGSDETLNNAGDEDEETSEWRKQKRLEQNKLSARRSRKRKKIILDELQATVDNLNAEYKVLEEENKMLTAELEKRQKLAKDKETAERTTQDRPRPTPTGMTPEVNQAPRIGSLAGINAAASQKIPFPRGIVGASATNAPNALAFADMDLKKAKLTTTMTARPSDIMTVGAGKKLPFFAQQQDASAAFSNPVQNAMNLQFSRIHQLQQQQQPTNNLSLLQQKILAAVAGQRLHGPTNQR